MASKLSKIKENSSQLIDQGNETASEIKNNEAQLQASQINATNAQNQVNAANARVKAAQEAVEMASQKDSEGRPMGDVEAAKQQLRMAQEQLGQAQARERLAQLEVNRCRQALTESQAKQEGINNQKKDAINSLDDLKRAEQDNLKKLEQLKNSPFSENSVGIIREIMNNIAEISAVKNALLQSLGEATDDDGPVGGMNFGGEGQFGEGMNQNGDLNISDEAMANMMAELGADEGLPSDAGYDYDPNDPPKVLKMSDSQKRANGHTYIHDYLDVIEDELTDKGLDKNDPAFKTLMSQLKQHYEIELEKDIRGEANGLYDDVPVKLITTCGAEFVGNIYDKIDRCDHPEVQRVYSKYLNDIQIADTNDNKGARYIYGEGCYINVKTAKTGDLFGLHKPYQTPLHEMGHNIDYLMGKGNPISESYGNDKLGNAIRSDFIAARGNRTNEEFVRDIKIYVAENKLSNSDVGNISDILESLTGIPYPLGAGHGAKYWNGRKPNKEFFAEVLDSSSANERSLQMMKQFFPSGVSVVQEILGGGN